MNLNTETQDNITLVRIKEKRVDASKSPILKEHLLDLIDDGKWLVGVDLTDVKLVDSSGLGALVAAVKRTGQNGRIVLWGLTKEVRAVFELTQLYKVFDIYENEQDALERLKAHGAG